MKTLIVEDDFTSRVLLEEILKRHSSTHVATNGREALDAVRAALEAGQPYDLICLDIMMPEMDGQEALKRIRHLEDAWAERWEGSIRAGIAERHRTKVIMTTALADRANVLEAIQSQCDSFLVKPIQRRKLLDELQRLNLVT